MLGQDPLAEPLEGHARREPRESVVALAEGAEEPRVALAERLRQRTLEADEERAALGGAAEMEQRVVRDADERGSEHRHERLVVVPVVQQSQVGEQVDDLLLVVVVPAGRAEGRQAELAERRLVEARIRPRGEEEDDLARRRLARIDELLHPARDVLRLGRAPVGAAVLVGRLVRDEQLDRRAERRVLEPAGRGEGLERVAEVGREEVVDDLQHLGTRAIVLGQREHAARGLTALAEDLDVGVAEAVDRLELVADEEEILGRQQIDQLALEPVRVLELVDEDGPEAPALPVPDRRVVAQEVARRELEVLEVERRLGRLRRGVGIGEAAEEILEQRPVSRGQFVQRSLLDRGTRLLVAREPVPRAAPRRDVREVEQALGRRSGARAAPAPWPRWRAPSLPSRARPCRRRRSELPPSAPRPAPRGRAGR